jgi:alanine-synthesizing transaminase
LAGLTADKKWLGKHRLVIKERLDYCLKRISQIDGIECESPGAAFYLFVKITKSKFSKDDKKFVLDLLHKKHVLVVHGSGFSPEFGSGHFRMVCLPPIEILNIVFDRISDFLK